MDDPRDRPADGTPPGPQGGRGTRRRRPFPRWRRSLASARVRIVVWHVLLLAGILGIVIVSTRVILLVRLDERIGRELDQEVEELRALAGGVDPVSGEPFGGDVARVFDVFLERNIPARNETFLTYVSGQPYLRSLNDPPVRLDRDRALTADWATLEDTARGAISREPVGEIAYQAVPLRVDGVTAGVFVAVWFRDVEAAEIGDTVRLAALVSGVALLFAAVIVWNVTGRVLRPAKTVAATARSITETDLTRRIDVRGADEIAEIAETFNQMLDRLKSAFTVQREFVDDAGHELRTPITIIRGHLELLEFGDAADRRATVALATDELDRMHRMVEDLLLLTKAQRPDFLTLADVELHELTSEVFHKATALAPRDWQLAAVAEGSLRADRQRLTQALVQLAQNAVQHTGEGQGIALGSTVVGGEARLWVADTGAGVAPEQRERIFERFARSSGSRGAREGAGLGLSIVRAIAEAHGGRVELTSAPGGGSTFTLALPGARAAEDPSVGELPATAQEGTAQS